MTSLAPPRFLPGAPTPLLLGPPKPNMAVMAKSSSQSPRLVKLAWSQACFSQNGEELGSNKLQKNAKLHQVPLWLVIQPCKPCSSAHQPPRDHLPGYT
jgi:hypothetical protein